MSFQRDAIVVVLLVMAGVLALLWRVSRSAPPERPELLSFDRFELKLARIDAGTFTMGSPQGEEGHNPDESAHVVVITKSFWVGVTTVTREQFARFVDDARYTTTAERRGRSVVNTKSGLKYADGVTWKTPIGDGSGDMPVVHVSDVDAVAFCKWASQRSGRKVRLPTEAEWEYACRAGTQTPHAGDLNNMGWFADNSGDAALDSAALMARRDGSFSNAIIANHCRP